MAEAAAADLGQQRAFQFVGNRVFQCGGVKLLGARHTTVVGNSFRMPVNYAVFVGADEAAGEGLRVGEDILISANNITDLVTADQAGAAVTYNVGIFISQFWKTVFSERAHPLRRSDRQDRRVAGRVRLDGAGDGVGRRGEHRARAASRDDR
jgi:hypothetical protein